MVVLKCRKNGIFSICLIKEGKRKRGDSLDIGRRYLKAEKLPKPKAYSLPFLAHNNKQCYNSKY